MTSIELKNFKSYLEDLKTTVNLDERDINIWCDIIEILCFTNSDKLIFREDIERELEKLVDGGIQLEALKEISRQMGFDIPDAHIFSTGGGVDWGSDDASKNDLLNQITNMWFSHLLLRQKEFGDYYPFKIRADRSEITSKNVRELSKSNKLYLYFLITSKRGGLIKARQTRLELDFEPIAFEAFKTLIPNGGKSHLMGKGTYTSTDFKVNKYNKFNLLANILKVQIKVSPNYFHPKDSGENGFDFIGWLLHSDTLSNNPVYAGQATCMRDWNVKYNESSSQNLGGILDTSKVGSYTNSLFIPYHFRVGNNWAYPSYVEAKNYILFDRFRILKSINIANIANRLIPHDLIKEIA
ncbi:hypothetical protein BH11BAC3_BH11BAC3_11740 [soil metagenome]